jgi:DNA-binding NarL/FixJ family response regulator
MARLRIGDFPVVAISKTCARCGGHFRAIGREYICFKCKQPELPKIRATRLSFREQQIAHLIREAKSNKEIAQELRLTVGTVKEYLFHIFRKLDLKNRTDLAIWDYTRGNACCAADRVTSPESAA